MCTLKRGGRTGTGRKVKREEAKFLLLAPLLLLEAPLWLPPLLSLLICVVVVMDGVSTDTAEEDRGVGVLLTVGVLVRVDTTSVGGAARIAFTIVVTGALALALVAEEMVAVLVDD